MFKLLLILLTIISLNAKNLPLSSGQILAHTQMFGDSKINPSTNEIHSNLIIENKIESIRGNIFIKTVSLISDKKDRDKDMYKLLNSDLFPEISFKIEKITNVKEDMFTIFGNLTLNGITKNIYSKCSVVDKDNLLNLNGKFSINLTDFNMEPPTLLFLKVRNQIDISYNLIYIKEN